MASPLLLHVRELGAGPPLVLLHGLFGMARNLGTIARAMAATHRVIALDLRNHGASPHGRPMDYPTMAADVIHTLEQLGIPQAAIMGHSMGGKLAMQIALTHPIAVSRVVISDIAPVRYPPRNSPILAAMRAINLHPDLTRAEADAALAAAQPDPATRAFLLQNLRLHDVESRGPVWRAGLAEIEASLPVIEGWEPPTNAPYFGPTLFIAGARSTFILPDHRETIRALFPTARFVTIKNAGHWVHADNPEGFNAVLQAFLDAPIKPA
ncbi:MAG: alpha/beta fold hydrolase [Acetobacteraceae bacterium]|nr:alpha/beta fold hydrolase [Acetobacteraceae bacterium]